METNNKKTTAEIISIRGTGKIYLPDNSFEFIPKKKGEPAQKDVKKYGNAKAYSTTGRDPKRFVVLQCAEGATDPATELTEQFKKVMKSEFNAPVPKELEPKGVILANNDGLKMTVNKTRKRIEVSFSSSLEPEGKRDYKTMFYDKLQEISKCFAINETLIQKSR